MRPLRSLPLAGVLAGALAAAPAASAAPPRNTSPRVSRPGTGPAGLALQPDLAATRAFVGTLNPQTNSYEPVPPGGVEAGRPLRVACFYANVGAARSGSFRVRHVIDGKVIGVSNPLPAL